MKKKAKPRKKSPARSNAKRSKQAARAGHPALSQSLSLLSEISQEIT